MNAQDRKNREKTITLQYTTIYLIITTLVIWIAGVLTAYYQVNTRLTRLEDFSSVGPRYTREDAERDNNLLLLRIESIENRLDGDIATLNVDIHEIKQSQLEMDRKLDQFIFNK